MTDAGNLMGMDSSETVLQEIAAELSMRPHSFNTVLDFLKQVHRLGKSDGRIEYLMQQCPKAELSRHD
jgi:hypothetical protein